MCKKVVEDDPEAIQFAPDWFVIQEQKDTWLDDDYDELIEWYKGYKKRKAQKAKIKKEHLPIAWHPSSMMNWCMSGHEKGVWR